MAKESKLIEEEELSHAARALQAVSLTPGTHSFFDELRSPALRPGRPVQDTPDIFVNRNEYLKLRVEDDVSFNAFYSITQRLARAEFLASISRAVSCFDAN